MHCYRYAEFCPFAGEELYHHLCFLHQRQTELLNIEFLGNRKIPDKNHYILHANFHDCTPF